MVMAMVMAVIIHDYDGREIKLMMRRRRRQKKTEEKEEEEDRRRQKKKRLDKVGAIFVKATEEQ